MLIKTNYTPAIGKAYVIACTALSSTLALLIFLTMAYASFPAIQQIGLQLLTWEWNPQQQHFGILTMLYGSLVVATIALCLATPLGILTALYTSEKLTRYRLLTKSALEILAGIPSIIYGLIGVVYLSPWVGDIFQLQTGRTYLTAGIILAIMILPTIITLCDDALHHIPSQYRDNAKGLGLYPYEILFRVLLPIARADIISAILLALGRALGETMAVMLIIGGVDRLPTPFFNILASGQTATSKLGREISESAFGSLHFSALIVMGLALIILVMLFTQTAQYFSPQRNHGNTQ